MRKLGSAQKIRHLMAYSLIDSHCLSLTFRYKRCQLLKLQSPEEKATAWVDMKELAANSHCLLLHRDPAQFLHCQLRRRSTLAKVSIVSCWDNGKAGQSLHDEINRFLRNNIWTIFSPLTNTMYTCLSPGSAHVAIAHRFTGTFGGPHGV